MSRLIFSTYEKGKHYIRYYATLSNDITTYYNTIGICCPCTCMCLDTVSKELRSSTFVQVSENHIEYNYPYSCLSPTCSCVLYDNVHFVYFDRGVMEQPYICETCFSTVVLRKPFSCSFCQVEKDGDHSSCCGMICLPFLSEPYQFVSSLEDIRRTRLEHQRISMQQDMDR